jgi:hypothetical protein
MNMQEDIIATIAYFDLFHYPLTAEEIVYFMETPAAQPAVEKALDQLVLQAIVFSIDGFFSLHNDAGLAGRRKAGNLRAVPLLKKARRIAAFLAAFPYVRGVAVSGSLSKSFAAENADIDFFLVTESNRLWLARTIMHCFKKLTFLFNLQDCFCMNYYVDTTALEIHEKNKFTAVEIATLLPLQGQAVFAEFFRANQWKNNWLPNSSNRLTEAAAANPLHWGRFIELCFNNRLGNRLEHWCRQLTDKRWKQKTQRGKKNSNGIVMSLLAGEHTARPDPVAFQAQLLNRYQLRLNELFHSLQQPL